MNDHRGYEYKTCKKDLNKIPVGHDLCEFRWLGSTNSQLGSQSRCELVIYP